MFWIVLKNYEFGVKKEKTLLKFTRNLYKIEEDPISWYSNDPKQHWESFLLRIWQEVQMQINSTQREMKP